MQYKIVTASSEYDFECVKQLEKEVEYWSHYGWELQGGVTVVVREVGYRTKYMMYQAMIKED